MRKPNGACSEGTDGAGAVDRRLLETPEAVRQAGVLEGAAESGQAGAAPLVDRLLHRALTDTDADDDLVELLQEAANRIERLQDALIQVERWSHAYPVEIFPEPDLVLARKLLEAGGMTLDRVAADAMRHVVEALGKIAREALDE